MRLVRIEEAAVRGGRNFRKGDIRFTDLLAGEEGTPANFGLMLVHVDGGYAAPRHRHNFEQVRIMLEGSFNFGRGQVQETGSVGYFCEGTPYTQDGGGKSTTLLLQIGGPSGQGFMSARQLYAAIDGLQRKGTLADGVFTWFDEKGGRHNQDSYEAAWELCHGRTVVYPEPQYAGPVLLRPERFRYRPAAGQPGVERRELGRFNDGGLCLSMVRLQPGARYRLDATAQAHLMFCLRGAGEAAGRQWEERSSIEIGIGERVELMARTESEFHVFGVPVFD